jgi:hypothetical protein
MLTLLFSGSSGLRFCSMALLELLAGAAGAGIVAADLVTGDSRCVAIACSGCCSSGCTGHVELALLLALKFAFELVNGG